MTTPKIASWYDDEGNWNISGIIWPRKMLLWTIWKRQKAAATAKSVEALKI